MWVIDKLKKHIRGRDAAREQVRKETSQIDALREICGGLVSLDCPIRIFSDGKQAFAVVYDHAAHKLNGRATVMFCELESFSDLEDHLSVD